MVRVEDLQLTACGFESQRHKLMQSYFSEKVKLRLPNVAIGVTR